MYCVLLNATRYLIKEFLFIQFSCNHVGYYYELTYVILSPQIVVISVFNVTGSVYVYKFAHFQPLSFQQYFER